MKIKRIAQVLISVLLLGVIASWIDLKELSGVLVNVNPWYIVLALFIATTNRILMAVKWNLLLGAKQIHLSWYEVTKLYYVASFLGLVLPSTVGSDVIKAYRVSRRGFLFADGNIHCSGTGAWTDSVAAVWVGGSIDICDEVFGC
jgi:uncharacterized protein (TIRG00374 family)